jgi:hypothetical protein
MYPRSEASGSPIPPLSDAGSRKLTALRALFTLTLFLSSGLLFLVQPMVAKTILPRFGGSPAVWTTSMLFFQVLLLAGYLYAHASVKWLGPKRQALLHVGVLLAATLLTHLALPATGIDNNPWQVLLVLAMMVGAPFLALSAGAPLIQRWFAATPDPAAKDPYFLYSASNLGSMIALLAYPFLLEPRLTLADQAQVWSYLFFALIGAMALCAVFVWRQAPVESEGVEEAGEPVSSGQKLQWVLLAAVPSSLLLGVTNYLTTNVAPMPLLWVVPLAIYLLTFIIAFARGKRVSSGVWARILPLIVTPLVLVMILEATEPMALLGGMHLLAFAIAALMCHSRLVETRPEAGRLTEFYVWLSVGGAVGGLFNALLAPTLFSTLAEYPLALVAASLLRPRREGVKSNIRWDFVFAVGMFLLTVGLALGARQLGMAPSQARTGLIIGLPAILCFLMVDHPIRYGLMIGALFVASNLMQTSSSGVVAYTGRSFFGVHRVIHVEQGRLHMLSHGNTIHGIQDTLNPGEPRTYYSRSGPVGDIFAAYPDLGNVGLVGLGVGSCAAYGKPGQKMTYFEIDPLVEKIARDERHFTFLRDSKADLKVVIGDARLTLGEAPDSSFDLLMLDAFSSDSIPVHLLTREAILMYRTKLKANGFIAFHISNRYLDLEPILSRIAADLGMSAFIKEDEATDEELRLGKQPSRWMLMASTPEDVLKIAQRAIWVKADHGVGTPLWTDDYSNILSAIDRSDEAGN